MFNKNYRPGQDFQLDDAMLGVPVAQPKKKKGFWLDQISTGGGIGGALAGAAGGAALGSVVPVVGTAVGGILGALLGGAGGSAAGQAGENAITGDRLDQGVAQEALIGGLTSLPVGAGFKLARAGLAGAGVGKKAASELIQEAGAKTVSRRSMASGKGAFGTTLDQGIMDAAGRMGGAKSATGEILATSRQGRLLASGNKALASQYGVLGKPTIRSTNPAETVSELAGMGITKPADAERIGSAITGADGILTNQVAKAVDGASGVDTSTLRQVFSDALDNAGIVEKDRASLTTMFDAQMNKLSGGARGSLNPKVNPTEALQTMKTLERRIADLRGKGDNYRMSTPEREDMAGVLKLVRDELEDQLYVGAGANKNLANILTPELRDSLVKLHPNNTAWAKYVDDKIMSAGDVGALRSAQAPFVKVGKIIDEGTANEFSAGGRMVTSANGIKGAILEGAQRMVRDPAARAYAGTTRAIAGGAGAQTGKAVGDTLPRLTARQVGGRGIYAALGSQDAPQDTALPLDDQTMQGQPQQAPQQEPSVGGYTQTQIENAMAQAMAEGNSKAFGDLQDLYKMLPQQGMDLNASTAALAAKQDSATSSLDSLLNQYDAAGGGKGKLGGTISDIRGSLGLDSNAATYNDSTQAAARQVSRALGEVGAGSNADADAYISMLPRLTDTAEQAALKVQRLKQMLADARENTLMYGAGATSGAEQSAY